jgi:hypothetical protein
LPCQTATGAGSPGAADGDSQPREKPQSRTNVRSSHQPATPELSEVRRQAATWAANSPGEHGLVGLDHQAAE